MKLKEIRTLCSMCITVQNRMSICFPNHRGLAMAAVGFHHRSSLSRVALALPFLLVAAQLFRPDSREAVALRLQKELTM